MNGALKTMWTSVTILSVVVLAGGCGQLIQATDESGTVPSPVVVTPVAANGNPVSGDVTLCGKCGHVKGTEVCCQEGADTCGKCELAKGSPGCCKI